MSETYRMEQNGPMGDVDALIAIQELLSGKEWSADTLEAIAAVMESAGYPILPYDGE
jgi:hypothetical protein